MIKQAIIPLAGLGTRLLPLTSVMPKELLPINGKPNLEYIMEECIQAGVKQFIFIISINKISIKKYFFKWDVIIGRKSEDIINLIRNDKIDILFDLSGHTKNNRLPLFAMRPAPLQISMIGYPNTMDKIQKYKF